MISKEIDPFSPGMKTSAFWITSPTGVASTTYAKWIELFAAESSGVKASPISKRRIQLPLTADQVYPAEPLQICWSWLAPGGISSVADADGAHKLTEKKAAVIHQPTFAISADEYRLKTERSKLRS